MASGTGLFDQWAQRWDPGILEVLGLGVEHLGPIVDLGQPFRGLRPEFASRWPALARRPWLPALGDGACSNVGAGCTTAERAALMVGTSGAMRVCFEADAVAIPDGLWCYRVDGRRLLLGGSLSNGGSLYAWLTETLDLPPLERLEEMLRAMEPDAHGLTMLPFLAGERSLGWVAGARAAIVGLSLATRPVDIVRAALETVAYRFSMIHERLREACPGLREIVGTGGALLASPRLEPRSWPMRSGPRSPRRRSPRGRAGARSCSPARRSGSFRPSKRRRPACGRRFRPIPRGTPGTGSRLARHRALYDVLVPHTTAARRPGS